MTETFWQSAFPNFAAHFEAALREEGDDAKIAVTVYTTGGHRFVGEAAVFGPDSLTVWAWGGSKPGDHLRSPAQRRLSWPQPSSIDIRWAHVVAIEVDET